MPERNNMHASYNVYSERLQQGGRICIGKKMLRKAGILSHYYTYKVRLTKSKTYELGVRLVDYNLVCTGTRKEA